MKCINKLGRTLWTSLLAVVLTVNLTGCGAKEYTFAGLTGIGDLIVTCTSKHSRNNRFGNKVGSGVSVEQALSEVGTVEGYYASFSAYNPAKKYRITIRFL